MGNTDARPCARCGLWFPLDTWPTVNTGLPATVCATCHPLNPIVQHVAAVAATHILRCVGASALIDMGSPHAARRVLDGHWPTLREAMAA